MKKTKAYITALLLAASAVAVTACASSDSSKSDNGAASESYEDRDLATDDKAVLDKILASSDLNELLTGELENKTIKWLSTWDINPGNTGKKVPADLYLFEQRYGGSIEYHPAADDKDLYDKLAASISSGDGMDFFYAGNLDAIPSGAINKQFAPADDYIDFSSPLWEDIQDVNDQLIWNGKHYTAVIQTTTDCAVLYNRKTIQEAGFEDPAVLFENGEWDWDTFQDMIEKFADPANDKYGIGGWWFEFGLMNTIGIPPVGLDNGKLVSNLGTPEMERVQNWMYDLYQTGCIAVGTGPGGYGWDDHPEYIGQGKLLFYPVGLWDIYKTPDLWKPVFGDDLFFVPMPKDPEASDYYMPVGIEAYSFISGGQNPEGVAKYLDCKRYMLLNDEARSIADAVFTKDYEWSQEMVDMKNKMQEISDENVAIDVSKGVSKDVGELLDTNLRLTTRGTPWNETYAAISSTIDEMLDSYNNLAE